MIDTKGLDEFRKAWDEAKESKEPKAADTGAVTDVDDFDYGDPVKDTAKAEEIKAALVVENKTNDSEKSAVQTTPEVAKPKLTFKQAFAAARKAGNQTFEWEGKKFALKLQSEVNKPVQTAKPAPVNAADEHTAAWNEDQSAAESSRLANSKPTMAVSTGLLGNFVPESWMGRNNNPETTKTVQVAKVASPVKTSSPSGRDYSGNAKAADSTKAIADKMGVDSKTLLPNGKGSQG